MAIFRVGSLLCAVLAGVTVGVGAAYAQADTGDAVLVWQDEFEGEGRPDTTKWRYETGFVRNRELQWYQRDNTRVEDGHLVIEGRREEVPNPNYDPDSDHWREERRVARYTSASLTARDAFAFQYGRVEVRARIGAEPGLWPAIWTVGLRHGWPEGGEIDIMEYYDDSILANVCWAGPDGEPAWDTVRKPMAWIQEQAGQEDWASRFHVWRMEWTPETIRLSVDGILLNTYDVSRATTESGFNPLRQPHVLKLNLAIGGTQGGDPSKTDFPAEYRIDYVRVYQRPPATH